MAQKCVTGLTGTDPLLLRIATAGAALLLFVPTFPGRRAQAQLGDRTFYIDCRDGADQNPGTSASSAWQSLSNLRPRTFSGGETILLRRGCEWRGGIELSIAGAPDLPVTIGAYGSGDGPILNGAEPVSSSWTRDPRTTADGTAVYRTPVRGPVAQVFRNGVRLELARHPNKGYFPISEVLSASSLRHRDSLAFAVSTARILLRLRDWHVDQRRVSGLDPTAQVLTWDNVLPTRYPPSAGYGYFLSNSLEFLDAPGEWFYNPDSQLLYLALAPTDQPQNNHVEVSTVPYGIYCDARDAQLRIRDLALRNFAHTGIRMRTARADIAGVAISNCNERGIFSNESRMVDLSDSLVEGSNADAVWLTGAEAVTVERNTILDNGRLGTQGNPGQELNGLRIGNSERILISQNTISRSGYAAIQSGAVRQSLTITDNRINDYCLYLNDCGGININATNQTASIQEIARNVVENGIGNAEGTPQPAQLKVAGIYLDFWGSGFLVYDNVVDRAAGFFGAIDVNGGNHNRIYRNTIYQYDGATMGFTKFPDTRFSPQRVYPMDANIVEDNRLVIGAPFNDKLNMRFLNAADTDNSFGIFRNNTLEVRRKITKPPRAR